MDRGLKERLIGAAVLVALGVWLIPWVLDGPERGGRTSSAALRLPTPDQPAPLRTQTIHLDQGRERPSPALLEEAAQSERSAAAASPAAGPAQAAPAAPTPPQTDSRAGAATAASNGGGGPWVIQLGSFGEAENAQRLAERVAEHGYQADISTHRASGRLMHRVRVGPEASRSGAEAIASSLSAHGFVAQVVTGD